MPVDDIFFSSKSENGFKIQQYTRMENNHGKRDENQPC